MPHSTDKDDTMTEVLKDCDKRYTMTEIVKAHSKRDTVAEVLKARSQRYGPYKVHAAAEQAIKRAMQSQPGWQNLNDVQQSVLDMVVHKIARILNGSADHADNWIDIAGYSKQTKENISNREYLKPNSTK